jgi:dTDP-4-amino-4,6-dideoxygalactose transaminase
MRLYRGEFLDIFKTLIEMKVSEGEYIDKFQSEFARYIGVRYAIATCTGRKGLELILEALELEKGDEIILPAYTLKDLIFLIQDKGYVSVLVDIDEDTYNIDTELIKKAITKKTKVIIATHIFGSPCDIEAIINIAEQYNISIIEDCAHATGAEYKGQKAGSFGKAAFFSFEAIKPINTFGGGMVATNDLNIASYVNSKISELPYNSGKVIFKMFYIYCEYLILHGPLYYYISFLLKSDFSSKIISNIYLSIHKASRVNKFRYSNLQAMIGLKQIKNLDKNNLLRREKANNLIKLLENDIIVQRILPNSTSVYYFLLIRTRLRSSEARRYLLKKGIDSGVGSEITDNCFKALYELDSPVVKKVYNHALQIPLYDGLRENDIQYIAESINKMVKIYPCPPL